MPGIGSTEIQDLDSLFLSELLPARIYIASLEKGVYFVIFENETMILERMKPNILKHSEVPALCGYLPFVFR